MSDKEVSPTDVAATDATDFTWADMLEEFAPADRTTFVELKNGKKIEITIPYDAGYMQSLEKQSADFVKLCNHMAPPTWEVYLPQSAAVLKMVFKLSKLISKPAMTQLEGLQLAKQNGGLLLYMFGKVMNATSECIAETEGAAIEDLGED